MYSLHSDDNCYAKNQSKLTIHKSTYMVGDISVQSAFFSQLQIQINATNYANMFY